jgi:hypothetical protein
VQSDAKPKIGSRLGLVESGSHHRLAVLRRIAPTGWDTSRRHLEPAGDAHTDSVTIEEKTERTLTELAVREEADVGALFADVRKALEAERAEAEQKEY